MTDPDTKALIEEAMRRVAELRLAGLTHLDSFERLATALEKAEAETERLKADWQAYEARTATQHGRLIDEKRKLGKRLTTQDQQIATYQEALKQIVTHEPPPGWSQGWREVQALQDIAQAILDRFTEGDADA